MRVLVAGLSIAVLVWSAAALAAGGPRVSGPASVRPGAVVEFHAGGFRPGSMLIVILAPAHKQSCCAARIGASFLVARNGGARLRFRMPLYYLRCVEGGGCRKIRWAAHERVSVGVFGYLQQAAALTSVRR